MSVTGMRSFRIGHSDEHEDGKPVIWHATATYRRQRETYFTTNHEVDAALDPVQAVLRLCERLVDGGLCQHCGKGTVFLAETEDTFVESMTKVLDGCLYAWDPEMKTFRRGCEGDAP